MCGIAGVIGGGADVRRMTRALAHRGPDDEQFHEELLGFRRLSIIDLEGGRQPMKGCGDLWLVFNGEIYNHRELRSRLSNHPFRTQSDSEVILHLYEEKGADAVKELDGMFAFALWDGKARTLFAARDRMGKKPFVYRHRGSELHFASELGALEGNRTVDREALEHYLALGYIPAPWTIFEGVRKLPPGHTLHFDGSRLRVERYWEPPGAVVPEREEAAAERVFRALDRAVAKRLQADVPLGGFLSGGLDSSIVAGLMSQRGPTRTFSIGFGEAGFDETPFARQAAAHFRTEHRELQATPRAAEILPVLALRHGEPFGDASSIPTYLLARMAREHVTVALSGDGGDELFGGYLRYEAIRRMAALRNWPSTLVRAGGFLLRPWKTNYGERVGRLLGRPEASLGELYAELVGIFPGPLRRELGLGGRPETLLAEPFDRPGADPASAAARADLATYLPNDLLAKVDIASMAHGLEVRCPFLDREVVDVALGIPPELRRRKGVLRRAFRGLVPRSILERPKQGFGVPLAQWLRGELRPMLGDSLEKLAKRGILEGPPIR
ncbi:MAG TPA: asparagine synthase (glutamine-hydrolyzing), partial [Planctomycetota bacterium]|nr:asparagine synthase (glutamine-hydrolyzing) [Planctomycetota bacterium]